MNAQQPDVAVPDGDSYPAADNASCRVAGDVLSGAEPPLRASDLSMLDRKTVKRYLTAGAEAGVVRSVPYCSSCRADRNVLSCAGMPDRRSEGRHRILEGVAPHSQGRGFCNHVRATLPQRPITYSETSS